MNAMPFPWLQGPRNHKAKLTSDQVAEVLLSDGPAHVLAKRLGVSASTIQRIRKGDTWKVAANGIRPNAPHSRCRKPKVPGKCAWCELPSEHQRGRITLCTKHFRISQMRHSARAARKSVPTREQLEALIPDPLVCAPCGRPMTWFRDDGGSRVATLQHDRDGGFRIICLRCNVRHHNNPGDTFYDIPAGHKHCGSCATVKPFSEFYPDRRRPMGFGSYCRDCDCLRDKRRIANGRPRRRIGQSTCPNGHPWSDDNTYCHDGRKYCRTCNRIASAELRARRASL